MRRIPDPTMRHIPEEELHAYLDQALSRNQCVEIECHLAVCPWCREERDAIASLRDRTTALLGILGPRRIPVLPPIETLARRKPAIHIPSPWSRRGRWAAMVAGAVLSGYGIHSFLDRQAARGSVPVAAADSAAPVAAPPMTVPLVVPPTLVDSDLRESEGGPPGTLSTQTVTHRPDAPPPLPNRVSDSPVRTLDIRSVRGGSDANELALGGLWKTVPWEEAEGLTSNMLPRIEGLPVLEVRVQQRSPEERPLVIVTQQYPGGETVRTIEGPVEAVASLVTQQIDVAGTEWRTSDPTRTPPEYIGTAGGSLPRRSIRAMTVIGRLPADTLNALRRRLALR